MVAEVLGKRTDGYSAPNGCAHLAPFHSQRRSRARAPAREALSSIITVHTTDGVGRLFVDVVGPINDGDFKTKAFQEKTDQIYPIGAGHPNTQMIVTLISNGGSMKPAWQIAEFDPLNCRRGCGMAAPAPLCR
jgi:hypothetical protein